MSNGKCLEEFNSQQRKKLIHDSKYYLWDDPYLWKLCNDGLIRRCVRDEKTNSILQHCHGMVSGGHFGPQRTAAKVLKVGFYWPTLFHDARKCVVSYDACQKSGDILKKNEKLQSGILEVQIFDVWGIDFMGQFLNLDGNKYILVCVNCMSKWVEAQACEVNDSRVVCKFLSNLFPVFRMTRAIISDSGTHFLNKWRHY